VEDEWVDGERASTGEFDAVDVLITSGLGSSALDQESGSEFSPEETISPGQLAGWLTFEPRVSAINLTTFIKHLFTSLQLYVINRL
jgi:hypothetical protein